MGEVHLVERRLCEAWVPDAWQGVTVVLAVSGGADSVALLRAMAALKTGGEGRLCVAHFNHRIRGIESQEDESFVVALSQSLGLLCEVGRAAEGFLTGVASDGLEASARMARYAFLEEAAARLGARYVVTAHTADDQAETILHRMVRGTGIAGLAGIARTRRLGPATLIRPLLGVRREELSQYLRDLGQSHRSDSSNADVRFTRNRIRHELLPYLARAFNAEVTESLRRLGTLAGEVQTVIDRLVERLADRALIWEPSGTVRIDAGALGAEEDYVVRELLMAVWRERGWPLQAMGFAQWELLAAMLRGSRDASQAGPLKRMFPGGILAEAVQGELRLGQGAEHRNLQ